MSVLDTLTSLNLPVALRDERQNLNFKSVQVRKQMYIAGQILDKLRLIDSTAVIAGGAPRDWYMNKPATDIDIFYHFHGDIYHAKDLAANLNILKTVFPEMKLKILGVSADYRNLKDVEDHANYMLNPNIRHVFEFNYRGQVFQLIDKVDKTLPIETFAYNVCQAWSDGVEICYTPMFKVGMDKRILIETGHLYSNSCKYKKKMQEKFKGWTYIAPRTIQIEGHGVFSNTTSINATLSFL